MPPTTRPSREEGPSPGAAYALGFEFVASIVGMLLVGYLVDRWRGTSPRWMLICVGVGFVVGLYSLFRGASRLNRSLAARRASRDAREADLSGKREPDERDAGAGATTRKAIDSWFESREIEEDSDDSDGTEPPGFNAW